MSREHRGVFQDIGRSPKPQKHTLRMPSPAFRKRFLSLFYTLSNQRKLAFFPAVGCVMFWHPRRVDPTCCPTVRKVSVSCVMTGVTCSAQARDHDRCRRGAKSKYVHAAWPFQIQPFVCFSAEAGKRNVVTRVRQIDPRGIPPSAGGSFLGFGSSSSSSEF